MRLAVFLGICWRERASQKTGKASVRTVNSRTWDQQRSRDRSSISDYCSHLWTRGERERERCESLFCATGKHLQASKFLQVSEDFRRNFNDPILLQTPRIECSRRNIEEERSLVQFNRCVRNISSESRPDLYLYNRRHRWNRYMDMDRWGHCRYIRCHQHLTRWRRRDRPDRLRSAERERDVPMLLHCFSSSINETISLEIDRSASWHRALRPRKGCNFKYLASQSSRQSQVNWLSWTRLREKEMNVG